MFEEYIFAPLHNLLLWLTGVMPGHSLALALICLALITKLILFVFIYHGHIYNVYHHHLHGHHMRLQDKHGAKNHKKIVEELDEIYEHYDFHPFKGLFIALIQFFVLFSILRFLIADVTTGFNHLDLVTMDNVFRPYAMNLYMGSFSLIAPLSNVFLLAGLFLIQFLSLEIHLLSKRKIHRKGTKEELAEHVLNIIISLAILFLATRLPFALSLYWSFFILLSILRKISFDLFLNGRILEKIKKVEKKIVKDEEPKIKKIDETLIYWLWKMFHFRTKDKNFHDLRRDIRKKFLSIHHKTGLIKLSNKIQEEPHLAAFFLFFS